MKVVAVALILVASAGLSARTAADRPHPVRRHGRYVPRHVDGTEARSAYGADRGLGHRRAARSGRKANRHPKRGGLDLVRRMLASTR